MATNPLLLGLAANSSSINFQIPSLSVKLGRDNYPLWRTTIISALETFDLENFVLAPNPPSETISVPSEAEDVPPSTAPNPEFQTWKRKDRFVLLWIKSTLNECTMAIDARASSSQQAWITLEKTYQAQTTACRMQMKLDLKTVKRFFYL